MSQLDELSPLLDGLCEGRLSAAEMVRLEDLVLASSDCRQLYERYLELHGNLYWDTAIASEAGDDSEAHECALAGRLLTDRSLPLSPEVTAPAENSHGLRADRSARRRRTFTVVATIAAAFVFAVPLTWWFLNSTDERHTPPRVELAEVDRSNADASETSAGSSPAEIPGEMSVSAVDTDRGPAKPFALPRRSGDTPTPDNLTPDKTASENTTSKKTVVATSPTETTVPSRSATVSHLPEMTTNPAGIVQVINDELKDGWALAGLTPSAVASDSEWQRRVMLSLVGRVPHADEVAAFQADNRSDKRVQLVERLLHDPGYVTHWTTVWSNLLIGRNPPATVDRDSLEDFLASSFAVNRPWNEVAFDLIAAVGDSHENGAANFLLAHLNNQAVPATAFTARLFLGTQVQCTQCHDHPFNDWKQNEFWELNSFFHQTTIAEHRGRDSKTGTPQMERELVTQAVGGPTFYESRRGVMRVAYPRYRGVVISAEPDVDRRRELARLMTDSDDPRFARAFVNRIWAHLFGAGFTAPVDDMGPHNPPSHPELLEELTQAFVASGYDFQQLLRWITTSDAYQRTTAFSENNQSDDPSIGASPWFSRVYVQPMTPEQVYDSLQVLGHARMADGDRGLASDGLARRERREWINSFIFVRETEENDEASTFDGTITRALTMMNGELIDRALAVHPSTYLGRVLQEPGNDGDRINRLCRAALSRDASRKELAAFTRQIQQRRSQALRAPAAQQAATAEAFQDILWAYLNSNEFILLH